MEITSTQTESALTPQQRRVMVASVSGTVIEWVGFALYSVAAGLIIGPLFFSGLDATGQMLAAFATFAVGFFVRPLGGIALAHLGDVKGRKYALMVTIALMGIGTGGMGLLPTYDSIGILAPILLVVCRLIQGLGAGAELGSAMVIIIESAPKNRRGYLSSYSFLAAGLGAAMAFGVFLLLSAMPNDVLMAWAWRLPFLASGVLVLLALWIRRKLDESPEFKAAAAELAKRGTARRVPFIQVFRHNSREFVSGVFAVAAHNVVSYVLLTFSVAYVVQAGVDRTSFLVVLFVGSLAGAIATPMWGRLSDRVGPRPLLTAGYVVIGVLAFPLLMSFTSGNIWLTAGLVFLTYVFGVALEQGGQALYLGRLYPAEYRVTGVTATREVNSVLFAGPTPYVAAWLTTLAGGAAWPVAVFLVIIVVFSIVGVYTARFTGEAVVTAQTDTTGKRAAEASDPR